MTQIAESDIQTLSMEELDKSDRTYSFRQPRPERQAVLRRELIQLGQLQPLSVEEVGEGGWRILDGFGRLDLFKKLNWREVRCRIFPSGRLSEQDRFRLLLESNFFGPTPYGLIDRARFVKSFYDCGVTFDELGRTTRYTLHELEDLFDLTDCDDFLGPCLNRSRLEPVFARMLARRYDRWIRTGYIREARKIARTLLRRAGRESVTIKIWRFYLDFYWEGERPSMVRG